MDQELKQKWVDALRSGKYKQARKRLRQESEAGSFGEAKFCCLGVLCDVVDPHGWDEKIKKDSSGVIPFRAYEGYDSYPPPSFEYKYGLLEHLSRRLADLNDEGKSFEEIALYIEKTM